MARVPLALFLFACALGMSLSCTAGEAPLATESPDQKRQYLADVAKTVVELQPFRHTQTQQVTGAAGKPGTATLIDLNPTIGKWYLLALDWGDGKPRHFHLENGLPGQTVFLGPDSPGGLELRRDGERRRCDLWTGPVLDDVAAQPAPYVPLCEGRLFLHNAVRGHSSSLEAAVEFLRSHVWAGEQLLTTTKQTLLKDAGREQAELGGHAGNDSQGSSMPASARLEPAYAGRQIGRGSLGLAVDSTAAAPFTVGQWVPVADVPGVFVSLIAPEAIALEILQSNRDRANALDAKESAALVYSIAFDLGQLDLGFGLGTDHPGVGWSPRPPDSVRVASLPGPDGIGTVRPLITTGMIPPTVRDRAVAAFAGGFKRYHGAFKYGALALRNRGSHYGFVQEGVVLSKLQPGLATLYVLRDGSVHMHAWTEEDNHRLPEIRYARQNGVPLLEWDATAGASVPGALVNQWGAGNWSGSANGDLRTVRAGACLQETRDTEYLVYGYFSNATPSAMARVFQAYGCHDAMLMDMNAPILTYLALYSGGGAEPRVQYLVQAMVEAEQKVGGQPLPRFLVVPDNRDFFYLTRRGGGSP